jgi:hypothetical protein
MRIMRGQLDVLSDIRRVERQLAELRLNAADPDAAQALHEATIVTVRLENELRAVRDVRHLYPC